MSRQDAPGRVVSWVLAVGMHALLLGVLFLGIRWQQRAPEPLMADLWKELPPARQAPAPPVRSEPVATPAPLPPAEPPPSEPPRPVAKSPPPPAAVKADIAMQERKRHQEEKKLQTARAREEQARRLEALREVEVERRRKLKEATAAKLEEEARRREEKRELDAERRRREQDKLAHQREQEKALDDQRRSTEQEMEKQARVREAQVLDQAARARDAGRGRQEEDLRRRQERERDAALIRELDKVKSQIRQRIYGKIVLPAEMRGNPEVQVSVTLLPGGEVLSVTLLHSSGVPAYDAAVERAIHAAEPLPTPSDPALFQKVRELNLKFRPLE